MVARPPYHLPGRALTFMARNRINGRLLIKPTSILFAVTSPSCATEQCGRNTADDGQQLLTESLFYYFRFQDRISTVRLVDPRLIRRFYCACCATAVLGGEGKATYISCGAEAVRKRIPARTRPFAILLFNRTNEPEKLSEPWWAIPPIFAHSGLRQD